MSFCVSELEFVVRAIAGRRGSCLFAHAHEVVLFVRKEGYRFIGGTLVRSITERLIS
jgi:hypothetical protein